MFVCVNQTGDRILSINGVSVEGMTDAQAGLLLKNATGTVTLQVMNVSNTHIKASEFMSGVFTDYFML